MVTLNPRDFKSRPSEAETMPFSQRRSYTSCHKDVFGILLLIRLGFVQS